MVLVVVPDDASTHSLELQLLTLRCGIKEAAKAPPSSVTTSVGGKWAVTLMSSVAQFSPGMLRADFVGSKALPDPSKVRVQTDTPRSNCNARTADD